MFEERKFRFSAFALGSALTLFLLPFALLLPGRTSFLDVAVLVLPGWMLAVGIRWFFPVYIGRDGIRGSDGIGRFHNVRWQDMQKVSNLFGFYWIRYGKWGKALSIPIFLEDPKAFRIEVSKLSPDDNSLRLFIQSRTKS